MELLSRHNCQRQISELVIETCRLVESDKSVRSVYIVAPERPRRTPL